MSDIITDIDYEVVIQPQDPMPETPDKVYSIEDLAQQIVNEAMGATIPLSTRVDAFKAITSYHLGVLKAKGKGLDGDDDDNVEDFGTIKDRIHKAG